MSRLYLAATEPVSDSANDTAPAAASASASDGRNLVKLLKP